MATSYDNATRLLPQPNNNRTLRRTSRESAGRRFLGDGTIGALSGVKLDIDPESEMVIMEKNLQEQPLIAEGLNNLRKLTKKRKSRKSNKLLKKRNTNRKRKYSKRNKNKKK